MSINFLISCITTLLHKFSLSRITEILCRVKNYLKIPFKKIILSFLITYLTSKVRQKKCHEIPSLSS